MRFRTLTALLLLAATVPASAADSAEKRIRASMEKLFPDDEVSAVTPSPVADLYEVMIGASLFYMSGDGRYVLRGDLIDLENKVNVSDRRRSEARQKVFAGLDQGDLIEFPAASGKASKVLYVYTDIDCGYCRKLHLEVPELNKADIAVRYLAFPRSGLKGESFDKAAAVWCSEDRRGALTAAKAGKKVSAPKCDSPVADQYHLGIAMGVSGTPAVYTADGQSIGGYVPAKELIRMVRAGKI